MKAIAAAESWLRRWLDRWWSVDNSAQLETPMYWWSRSEDASPAGGWQCDGSNAKASRETMVVPRVRKYSIWLRPALTVKCYDNGEITLSEGEWRL